MIAYPQQSWRDKHRQTEPPYPVSEFQSQSANQTGTYLQRFNVPHLPTILNWYLSSVSTIYIMGCSQYRKSDKRALNGILDLQLLEFADRF